MVKDVIERKEGTIISIADLKLHVLKMEQDLNETLLLHANELMRNGFELNYKCLNIDWQKSAIKLLEQQGFIVIAEALILKITVPSEKQIKI